LAGALTLARDPRPWKPLTKTQPLTPNLETAGALTLARADAYTDTYTYTYITHTYITYVCVYSCIYMLYYICINRYIMCINRAGCGRGADAGARGGAEQAGGRRSPHASTYNIYIYIHTYIYIYIYIYIFICIYVFI